MADNVLGRVIDGDDVGNVPIVADNVLGRVVDGDDVGNVPIVADNVLSRVVDGDDVGNVPIVADNVLGRVVDGDDVGNVPIVADNVLGKVVDGDDVGNEVVCKWKACSTCYGNNNKSNKILDHSIVFRKTSGPINYIIHLTSNIKKKELRSYCKVERGQFPCIFPYLRYSAGLSDA